MLVPSIILFLVLIVIVSYLVFQAGDKTGDMGNKN